MPIIKVETRAQAEALVEEFMRRGGSPIRVTGSVSNMTDEEFTRCRRNAIDGSVQPFGHGGSDKAILHGIRGARADLYNRLLHPEITKLPNSADTQHLFDTGHAMEPLIIKRFEHMTGHTILMFDWQLVNEDWPHFIANVDGLYIDKDTHEMGVLEIKTPQTDEGMRPWKTIAKFGNAPGLGKHVPEGYRFQVYSYLAATRLPVATIVGSTGWGLKDIGFTQLRRLPADAERKFMQAGENFILQTAKGILPDEADTQSSTAVIRAYEQMGQMFPTSKKVKSLPEELLSVIRENERLHHALDEADKEIKKKQKELKEELGVEELTQRLKATEATIAQAMGMSEQGVIEVDGETHSVTYKNTEKHSFDQTRFKIEQPALYKQYYGLNKTKSRPIVCTKGGLKDGNKM